MSVRVLFEDKERKRLIAEKQEKTCQQQALLVTIAEKRSKGNLTLEDIDDKLNIVLEKLDELLTK